MEEHHINIEGTVNQRYPNILKSIIKDKDKYPTLPPFNSGCYIYRVNKGLRNVKPKAYEPMVVSIGPYHLQNSELQAMKKHKLWYLHSLLERANMRVETLILELEKLEDTVRECYDEPIHLNCEKFVEMMLLDGCFIIEFFRSKTYNPKLTAGWMKTQILNDMMLLENQLPFFLLSRLYDMTRMNDDPEETLMTLMMKAFVERIPLPCVNVGPINPREIMHLLHLVHALYCPSMLIRSQNQDGIQSQMNSAVELQEAGVKFKKLETANLFDIRFKNGLMELPLFCVDDSTDTFFRNLIAFEQHSEHIVPRYFTDLTDFMDQLISSKRDVKLLRHEGIIENFLGDDTEVSNIFNKLGDGVTLSLNSYFSDVRMKVNKHCKKSWNKRRAKLMRDYFNSPWVAVSTIAGVVLLFLTLLDAISSAYYAFLR